MIGDDPTEINVTSPTGIRQVSQFGGPDIAAMIWDVVEKKVKTERRRNVCDDLRSQSTLARCSTLIPNAEFKTRDIEFTMATMAANPHVNHVPVMTGGCGSAGVPSFYETWFIGRWPEDVKIALSRATGRRVSLVDELILSFTHDCDMSAILPGIRGGVHAKWTAPRG